MCKGGIKFHTALPQLVPCLCSARADTCGAKRAADSGSDCNAQITENMKQAFAKCIPCLCFRNKALERQKNTSEIHPKLHTLKRGELWDDNNSALPISTSLVLMLHVSIASTQEKVLGLILFAHTQDLCSCNSNYFNGITLDSHQGW